MKPAILLLIVLLAGGCGKQNEPAHEARILAFGTLIDVIIAGESKVEAEAAISQLEQMFQRLHKNWHAWEPGLLGQTNRQLREGKPFTPHPEIVPLLKLSISLAEKSEHLFNPTIGKLIDAWGFQGKNLDCDKLPEDEKLRQLLQQQPKMSDLKLHDNKLENSNPAIKLDFGAIGKGYGLDLAIGQLRKSGIENALINAGGDLRAIGNRDGRPWRIAVRRPSGEGIFAYVETSGDESVFTSGDYERNFRCNGEHYHHIIDPRNGKPARGARSVTVIHSDAATADAAATALFVAGPTGWQRIASKMGIRYVALVDDQGVLHINPAMQKRLRLLDHNIKVELSEPIEIR